MKVLLINKFLYPKGGDAVVTLNTGRLLAERGHEVHYWGMRHPDNPAYPHADLFVDQKDYLRQVSLADNIRQSLQLLYSFEAKAKLERLLERVRPDVVHLHNFAHQISPSILPVFSRHRLPVVMTMHDYKLVCPVYTLYVNGRTCRRCQGGRYYWCARQKCAKGSLAKSLLNTAEMYLHHRVWHLYDRVQIYLSPSRFLQDTVRELGFSGEVRYLPNFIDAASFPAPAAISDRSFVYFGRLSAEKGLKTLIAAVAEAGCRVKIIGDGPQRAELEKMAEDLAPGRVSFLGYLRGPDLHGEVQQSQAVIQPSEWFENNPLSVLEAFALGRPVIGAAIGGIAELVRDGKTGLTFEAGNVGELRERLDWMSGHPAEAEDMGRAARQWVADEFNAERYYTGLMEIYSQAIEEIQ